MSFLILATEFSLEGLHFSSSSPMLTYRVIIVLMGQFVGVGARFCYRVQMHTMMRQNHCSHWDSFLVRLAVARLTELSFCLHETESQEQSRRTPHIFYLKFKPKPMTQSCFLKIISHPSLLGHKNAFVWQKKSVVHAVTSCNPLILVQNGVCSQWSCLRSWDGAPEPNQASDNAMIESSQAHSLWEGTKLAQTSLVGRARSYSWWTWSSLCLQAHSGTSYQKSSGKQGGSSLLWLLRSPRWPWSSLFVWSQHGISPFYQTQILGQQEPASQRQQPFSLQPLASTVLGTALVIALHKDVATSRDDH